MRPYRPDEPLPRYLPSHPGRKPPGAYRKKRLGRRQVRLFRPGDEVEVLGRGARHVYGVVVGPGVWVEGREHVDVRLTEGVESLWIGKLRRMR